MIDVFHKDSQSCFRVRVQPRSSRNRVAGLFGSALKVQLTAPPLDGRANKQLLELLSDVLRIPSSSLSIVAGRKAREKTVSVLGLGSEELAALLEGLLGQGSSESGDV